MFGNLRGQELLIILLIIVLLFGAKKLPETARGLGRSLRIFKAETKGLAEDDTAVAVPPAVVVPPAVAVPPPVPPATPVPPTTGTLPGQIPGAVPGQLPSAPAPHVEQGDRAAGER